eukprot:1079381-Prymnesium_polylepis.1
MPPLQTLPSGRPAAEGHDACERDIPFRPRMMPREGRESDRVSPLSKRERARVGTAGREIMHAGTPHPICVPTSAARPRPPFP